MAQGTQELCRSASELRQPPDVCAGWMAEESSDAEDVTDVRARSAEAILGDAIVSACRATRDWLTDCVAEACTAPSKLGEESGGMLQDAMTPGAAGTGGGVHAMTLGGAAPTKSAPKPEPESRETPAMGSM